MASDDYQDFREMEERLYAQIHHDHQRNAEPERHFQQPAPRFPHNSQHQNPSNRPETTQFHNRGRYWANNEESYQQQSNQRRPSFERRRDDRRDNRPSSGNSGGNRRDFTPRNRFDKQDNNFNANRRTPPRNFTIGRYQTVAGGAKQFEKRTQSNNFPLRKKGPIKGVNPFNVANQEKVRLENKIRIMQKKKKALQRIQSNTSNFKVPELPSTSRAHQNSRGKQQKITQKPPAVNTKVIFVDSCSDSESLDGSLMETKDIKTEKIDDDTDLNASQDDDVIMIPTPAPEVVNLVDSDEDSQDVPAKSKPKEPSSRCVSPSNSSILSDDFIGQSDRSRLQSEFLFVLPEDEDVQTATNPETPNKSTTSEDSNHSDDTTFPIGASQMMPKTVGDLGGFIHRGAAVENSLADKSADKSQQFANADGDTSDEEEEQETPPTVDDEPEIVENVEETPNNEVIEIQDDENLSSRKRTLSNRSSECDIMLNISSKRREKSVPPTEVATNSSFEKEILTIQVDDEDDMPVKLDPEIGWNDEMKRYYYESWGGEGFQLRRILSGMCPDRKNWRIDMSDRYPPAPIKLRNRCRNCQEFSHKVQNCPLPKRKVVCHMCGETGHREPRCPNSLCLTCGTPQNQFMRYCRRCIDNRRKRCTLCGVRGHIFAQCPDKWRRYHNTIEDNVPLDETYVANPQLWCSVCSSNKHQAHNCLQAETEMGRPLPPVKTVSYNPWYKLDLNAPKVVNTTDFSMMSFAKDFSFNWSSTVTENEHGFYNRFREMTGLMGEIITQDVESELKRVRRSSRRSEKSEADEEIEMSHIADSTIDLNDSQESVSDASGFNNFSFTKEMEKISEPFQLNLEKRDPRLEQFESRDEQKREISEMASRIGVTEEEILSARGENLPNETPNMEELDFIPLESTSEAKNDNSEGNDVIEMVEEKTDAKVFLTKEHSKYLLNEGESFLHKASQKYDLKLRVVWENIGNMLQMHGLPSNQNIFYNELLDFLKNVTLEEHIKSRNNSFTIPKVKEKLIKFIEEHLQRLKGDKKSLPHLKDLIRKMNIHQKNQQFKSADKVRRQLNVFLLGKNGLRDGKMHLIGIIKQYQSLKDNKPGCESPEFRDSLKKHFLYIFTAYDHENYEKLLEDYESCVQTGKWPIPLKALFNFTNMIRMANGENVNAPRDNEQPSTSKESKNQVNDSLLFFEDNIGDGFQVLSSIEDVQDTPNVTEEPSNDPQTPSPEVVESRETPESDESPAETPQILEIPDESPPEPAESTSETPDEPILPPKTPEKANKSTPSATSTPHVPKETPSKTVVKQKYSEASRKIISEAMNLFNLMNNQKAISKLRLVEQKANQNQITEEDYQSLLHIQKIVQSKMSTEKS
ncbi:uncharacterized protein LOC134832810 [Culicoides brevitarsis]|uniref:uncharacterized protein LOC134832810 n=1 Tax=Culicoides brevitarsis TaxID=469753 RepID=UPI00307C3873